MLYEDRPAYGLLLKAIIIGVPASLLIGALIVLLSEDTTAAYGLLLEALVIGLVFWLIFPRSYRIYPDHIRIVLGGPLSVRVRFENIKVVKVSSGPSFGINFATTITRKRVDIVQKRGRRIAITPRAPEQFVANAERALQHWQMAQGQKVGVKSPLF